MKSLASFKFIGATIALLLITSGTTHAAPQRGDGPPPVVGTMKVTERDANIPEKYIGHVEAVESIDLKARVSGYLEQVNFSEGSTVKKGQVLYVIEQAPYKAQVAAAEASVAAAEACAPPTRAASLRPIWTMQPQRMTSPGRVSSSRRHAWRSQKLIWAIPRSNLLWMDASARAFSSVATSSAPLPALWRKW